MVGRVRGLWDKSAGSPESQERLVSGGGRACWEGDLWLPESQPQEQSADDSF